MATANEMLEELKKAQAENEKRMAEIKAKIAEEEEAARKAEAEKLEALEEKAIELNLAEGTYSLTVTADGVKMLKVGVRQARVSRASSEEGEYGSRSAEYRRLRSEGYTIAEIAEACALPGRHWSTLQGSISRAVRGMPFTPRKK